MNLKKILGLLLIGFLIFFILSFPDQASSIVRSIVDGLGDAASNLAEFVRSIFA